MKIDILSYSELLQCCLYILLNLMFSRYMYLLFLQFYLVVLCENKCKIWRPKFPRLFKCTATECGSEFIYMDSLGMQPFHICFL